MVGPSEALSKGIGNSYAAAVHANIACLVSTLGAGLEGKRVGSFSYGSGAIATMMAFDGARAAPGARISLGGVADKLRVAERLAARRECEPVEYAEAMAMRERAYGKLGAEPAGGVEHVAAGAYYVKGVAADGVRTYARK